MSGGEEQMIGMGRSTMGRPTLILLGEPSIGAAALATGKAVRSGTVSSSAGDDALKAAYLGETC